MIIMKRKQETKFYYLLFQYDFIHSYGCVIIFYYYLWIVYCVCIACLCVYVCKKFVNFLNSQQKFSQKLTIFFFVVFQFKNNHVA